MPLASPIETETYSDLVTDRLDVPGAFFTVDVEDYFHETPGGEAFFEAMGLRSNLARNLNTLLDLFAEHQTKATFFILGCVAHRIKPEVQRMLSEGHEIGCHGHGHLRATWVSRDEFTADIRRGKDKVEDVAGCSTKGFRAPFFAITNANLWALDTIQECGFEYDSSVCPVKNFAYGIADAPEMPHRLRNGLIEFPMSQKRLFGYRFLVSGGFYLRAYPFWFTRLLLSRRDPTLASVFYIHPWEWDSRELNAWDSGIDSEALRWKPRTMKFITTYNRRKALTRYGRLLDMAQPSAGTLGSVGTK